MTLYFTKDLCWQFSRLTQAHAMNTWKRLRYVLLVDRKIISTCVFVNRQIKLWWLARWVSTFSQDMSWVSHQPAGNVISNDSRTELHPKLRVILESSSSLDNKVFGPRAGLNIVIAYRNSFKSTPTMWVSQKWPLFSIWVITPSIVYTLARLVPRCQWVYTRSPWSTAPKAVCKNDAS